MRVLPTMEVYQPADDLETQQVMEYLCQSAAPAYLRLTRQNLPRVHDASYRFRPGKLDVLREGQDVALLVSGGPVGYALEAANALAKDGLEATVVNVPTIKPFDTESLARIAGQARLIVTVEDHNVIGGMGGAVAEALGELGLPVRLHRHGLHDVFGESGTQADLYRKYRLDAEGIAAVTRARLASLR
jgi:transketolase